MALISHVSDVYTRLKKAVAGVGFVVRASDTSTITSDPVIHSGSGAPDDADGNPDGSIYMRTNGSVYAKSTTYSALNGTAASVGDDTAFTFGTDSDISIEYDEDGTDDLRVTNGASDADIVFEDDLLVFLGTDKDVWLEYDEDGGNTGVLGGTSASGWMVPDDTPFYLGTDLDVKIEFDEDGTNVARVTGAGWDFAVTLDVAASVTAADQLINADLSVNHATAAGAAIDVQAIQLTTARSSGNMDGVKSTTTSLATDSGGVYSSFRAAAPTDGGGSATHNAIIVESGYDALLDVSAAATGEADIVVGDNLASALQVREASTAYLTVDTTDDKERVSVSKILTMPSVTTVDMADAAHALVLGTAGAGETKLTGNIVFCDANSSTSETLTLPPEADADGLVLYIANTGGEDITVASDAPATVITISSGECGLVMCDGTTWFGFIGAAT